MSDDVVGREPVSRSHRLFVRLYFYRWPIAIVAAGFVVAALVLIGGVGFIVTLLAAALMLTIWVTFITTWVRGISRAGKAGNAWHHRGSERGTSAAARLGRDGSPIARR